MADDGLFERECRWRRRSIIAVVIVMQRTEETHEAHDQISDAQVLANLGADAREEADVTAGTISQLGASRVDERSL